MYLLYIACLFPVFLGMLLWIFSKEVNLIEWLVGSAVAFLTAAIIHLISFQSQTGDFEVWSGSIVKVRQFSEWREYYEEAVYKTVTHGTGKNARTERVFSHWSPRTRLHEAYWEAYSDIGTTHGISKNDFERFCKVFNSRYKVGGDRRTMEHASRMISGDPYDYLSDNTTRVVIPIHVSKSFTNRIKAAPSVFSFASVPQGTPVFDYPEVSDVWNSSRVLGEAQKTVSTIKWDQMNAVLGPIYRVNVLLVGFNSPDSMLGEWQKAKWIGGKKNDLILCYGKGWARVYSWSQSDVCKKALESVLLAGPIDDTLPDRIAETIRREKFVRRDWHDFDYLSVEPSETHWIAFLIVLVITQISLYYYFHFNEHSKDIGWMLDKC
jgi:hypothetical protein